MLDPVPCVPEPLPTPFLDHFPLRCVTEHLPCSFQSRSPFIPSPAPRLSHLLDHSCSSKPRGGAVRRGARTSLRGAALPSPPCLPPPSLPPRRRRCPVRSRSRGSLRPPRQCGAAAPRPAPAMDTSDLFTSCKKGDVSRVR